MKKTTNLHVSISVPLYSLSLIRSLLLVSSVLLSLTQPALLRTLNSSHVAARPDRVKMVIQKLMVNMCSPLSAHLPNLPYTHALFL